ncbi:MAG TPA: response regulator [Planctomycetota bacterium]
MTRALVMDGRKTPAAATRKTLRLAGFDAFGAVGSREALGALEEGRPVRLALVDWDLPGGEGRSFVRDVRGNRAHDHVWILMVTAVLDTAEILEAMRLGVDDCLIRPVTRERLLEKLTRLPFAGATARRDSP